MIRKAQSPIIFIACSVLTCLACWSCTKKKPDIRQRSQDALSFAKRSPTHTRLLARVDTTKLSNFQPGAIPILGTCDIELQKDLTRVDVAFADVMQWRVDLTGALTIEKIACLLGKEPGNDGSIDLGNVVIKRLMEGKICVSPKGTSESVSKPPEELAQRFAQSYPDADFVVVAALDRANLTGTMTDERAEVRLSFSDPNNAERAKKTMTGLLENGRESARIKKGMPEAMKSLIGDSKVDIDMNGNDLIIGSDPTGMAMALRVSMIESFQFPSGSMRPTLVPGDRFFVLKDLFKETVRRGSVITYLESGGEAYVKRVIAIGGDEVKVSNDGQLIINKKPISRGSGHPYDYSETDELGRFMGKVSCKYFEENLFGAKYGVLQRACGSDRDCMLTSPGTKPACDLEKGICLQPSHGPHKVPDDHVFVLGDNRDNSRDSRHTGPVPVASIIGTVGRIWWSSLSDIHWDRIGMCVQ